MKICGFMCITNPKTGKYPYLEAIVSHMAFLDKLFIIDGGSTDGSVGEVKSVFAQEIASGKLNIYLSFWHQGKGNWTWDGTVADIGTCSKQCGG